MPNVRFAKDMHVSICAVEKWHDQNNIMFQIQWLKYKQSSYILACSNWTGL